MFKKNTFRFACLIITMWICYIPGSKAQEAFVVMGGNIFSDFGNVSYSVGQIFFSRKAADNMYIIEGVQQAAPTATTNIEEEVEKKTMPQVWPNPVDNILNFRRDSTSFSGKASYRLYNTKGELILQKNILESVTQIDMSGLSSSLYLIKIMDDDICRIEKVIIKR